jgi:DNA-binding IclR family transcriptional regulator
LGMQPVHLYEIVSKHDIRVTDINLRTGTPFTGASGKILLSQLSDTTLEPYLKTIQIPQLTQRTVTDGDILMAQIKDIRKNGYAASLGERIPGAICLSSPVMNYTSPIGISIVGPESRLKPKMEYAINELKTSCLRVSRNVLDIYAIKTR